MRRERRGGMTLIELLVALSVVGLLCALVLCAVQSARESSRRLVCRNNLRQIGLAMNSYVSKSNLLPSAMMRIEHTACFFSAFTHILSDMEGGVVFNAINFEVIQGVGSAAPANATASAIRLGVLACPSDGGRVAELPSSVNYR